MDTQAYPSDAPISQDPVLGPLVEAIAQSSLLLAPFPDVGVGMDEEVCPSAAPIPQDPVLGSGNCTIFISNRFNC